MKNSKAIVSILTAMTVFACSKQNPPDLRPKTGSTTSGQTTGKTSPTADVTKEKQAPEDLTKSLPAELSTYVSTVNDILAQKGKPALRVTAAMNKAAEENGKKNLEKIKDKTYAPGTITSENGPMPIILTTLPADKIIEQKDLVKGIEDADVNVIGVAQIPNEKGDGKVTVIIMGKETAPVADGNLTPEQIQNQRQPQS